jgi:hypothetical protein
MRLNPHYPQWYLIPLSSAAYHGYQYEEAIHAAEEMATPTLESLLYLALSWPNWAGMPRRQPRQPI